MKDLQNKNVFNLEHDAEQNVPAYILESWIVDNPKKDKAYTTYGIEVPKGTLMLTAQVTDVDYYNTLVKNEQVGFSIEGFLGMKLSKHLNKYNMNFPDGEHTIEDKIYVVKDGKVVEIKDVVKEEMAEVTEEVTEEVEMSETSVEEEVVEEATDEVVEEEMAIDPAMDTEAILAIVKPLVEEQVNAVIGMIADLKNQMEEMLISKEEEEDIEMSKDVKMSAFDKFKAFRAFSK
jgi:hypothetical protein